MSEQVLAYDLHVHTKYSPDATVPLCEYAKKAEQFALHVGFLDHFELAFTDRPGYLHQGILPQLFEEFDQVHENYPNTSLGLEIDYYSDLASEVAEFCDEYRKDLDYLIGVAHTVDRLAVTTPEDLTILVKKIGLEAILQSYFNEVEAAIESGLFEGIAHLDGVMRFLPWYKGFEEVKSIWLQRTRELGQLCIKKNLLIEINLYGRFSPWAQYSPSYDIINELIQKGARFYVGSDSHTLKTFIETAPLVREVNDYLRHHRVLGLPKKLTLRNSEFLDQ